MILPAVFFGRRHFIYVRVCRVFFVSLFFFFVSQFISILLLESTKHRFPFKRPLDRICLSYFRQYRSIS